MNIKSVCLSGHRDISLEESRYITERLEKELDILIKDGYNQFYVGGAKGFDFLAAGVIVKFIKQNPDIRLNLVFPYKNNSMLLQYKKLLPYCKKIEYACEFYRPWCYHMRNRMMVDRSEVCICYLNKQSGGTLYTANYAKDNGLKLILI